MLQRFVLPVTPFLPIVDAVLPFQLEVLRVGLCDGVGGDAFHLAVRVPVERPRFSIVG